MAVNEMTPLDSVLCTFTGKYKFLLVHTGNEHMLMPICALTMVRVPVRVGMLTCTCDRCWSQMTYLNCACAQDQCCCTHEGWLADSS